MLKHYVTFFSPGTFVAEQSVKEIEAWDVNDAVTMSKKINERYGAKPYAFQFSTRERGDKDFDSKESKRSGLYYLGGKIETLDQIKKRNNPAERILVSNMECNGWSRVVTNTNSYKWTQPLYENDTVLDLKTCAPTEKEESAITAPNKQMAAALNFKIVVIPGIEGVYLLNDDQLQELASRLNSALNDITKA
jgi:hypothetical protein